MINHPISHVPLEFALPRAVGIPLNLLRKIGLFKDQKQDWHEEWEEKKNHIKANNKDVAGFVDTKIKYVA